MYDCFLFLAINLIIQFVIIQLLATIRVTVTLAVCANVCITLRGQDAAVVLQITLEIAAKHVLLHYL